MQRRHLLALGTAATLPLFSFAQGGKPQPLKFTLDFRISGQVAPFLLAQAKGYYAQEGLAPSFDVGSGSVAAITRVASGFLALPRSICTVKGWLLATPVMRLSPNMCSICSS